MPTFVASRSRLARVIAAVALAAGVAACSSSGGAGTGTTQNPGGGRSSSNARSADKSPIDIGVITTQETQAASATPGVVPNAQAAIKAINASGAINGHPINLKVCDQHYTSAGSVACWQQFSSDKNMVAVVGSTDCFDDASAAIIKASGLATLGRSACGLTDYSNPLMFFMSGGVPVDSHALGVLLSSGQTAALIRNNLPQSDAIQAEINRGASQSGGTITKIVYITPTTADLSAAASSAIAANTDAVIVFVAPSQAAAAVKQLKQLGYKGQIIVSASVFGADVVKSLGSLVDGVVAESSDFPAIASGVTAKVFDQYKTELAAAGADQTNNYNNFTTWLAFHAFQQIMATSSDEPITRASALKALQSQSNFSYSDASPGFDLGVTKPGPIANGPRVTNPWIVKLVAKDGMWTWDGTWLNAFTGKQG